MRNDLKLPLRAINGLNTDIMFGIRPVDSDKGDIRIDIHSVHWMTPGVKLQLGTCMLEFCEANIGEPVVGEP